MQRIMSDVNWSGVEAYFHDFMLRNFALSSIKRDNEFETIWAAAFAEGGKHYIQEFMKGMEEEAGKVETQ